MAILTVCGIYWHKIPWLINYIHLYMVDLADYLMFKSCALLAQGGSFYFVVGGRELVDGCRALDLYKAYLLVDV